MCGIGYGICHALVDLRLQNLPREADVERYDDCYYTPRNLTGVTYSDGSAKIYHYENNSYRNHLTGISHREPGGATTRYATYTYDTGGRASTTQHAGGAQKYTFTYNSATQTTVKDAANTQEVMTFVTTLGVKNATTKVNQTDAKTLEQTFDGNNNPTCRKDEESGVTTYAYNATNQRVSMTQGRRARHHRQLHL